MRWCLLLGLAASVASCYPWTAFESKDGRYRVEMPAEPQVSTEQRRTPLGNAEMIWQKVERGDVVFWAGFAELPGDKLRRTSSKRVLQSMQQLNAMDSEKKIADVEWDMDLRGMRFLYLQAGGAASAHYYAMRDNRFYELRVEGPVGEVRGEDVDRFFASVEFQ